jgi:hypothetical protein
MADIQPGQVWADNDPRSHGRQVRIVALDATHATVELVTPRQVATLSGQTTTAQPGRRSRISLSRFRATSTGYRLVQHPDGSAA